MNDYERLAERLRSIEDTLHTVTDDVDDVDIQGFLEDAVNAVTAAVVLAEGRS